MREEIYVEKGVLTFVPYKHTLYTGSIINDQCFDYTSPFIRTKYT